MTPESAEFLNHLLVMSDQQSPQLGLGETCIRAKMRVLKTSRIFRECWRQLFLVASENDNLATEVLFKYGYLPHLRAYWRGKEEAGICRTQVSNHIGNKELHASMNSES